MNRTVAAISAALLLGSAAGCGGSTSSGGSSGATGGGASRVADAPDKVGRGDLPDSFPMPPGAGIVNSVKTGPRISVTVRLVDGAAAVRFWTDRLPAAGYKIFAKEPEPDAEHALFQFTGNGWDHGTVAVNGNVGAIIMTK